MTTSHVVDSEPTEIPDTELAGVAGGVRYAIDSYPSPQCAEPEGASAQSIAQPGL